MQKVILADDLKESVGFLLKLRLPWLVAGLLGGFGASVLISNYEAVLAKDVRLTFFLPVIVYLSDVIGTQTETIYVRNMAEKKGYFHTYLVKESLLGIIFGIIFGGLTFGFTYLWFQDVSLSSVVSLAMAASVAVAPLVALFTAKIFQTEHQDPAVGAGPFKTIFQDVISILIYFTVASVILFI
jgi:magnesium transporter